MADEGIILTHHYVSAPVCAPSRASFLLGLHQGHANVRDNQFDKELDGNLTVANLLQKSGYYTAHVGKYGVAGGKNSNLDAHPLSRGFDEFFGYLFHGAGHEHYPQNGTTDKRAFLYEGLNPIDSGTDLTYTTDVFTARAKKIIVERQQHADQPFFLYLAYDVPHFKMQIPSTAYPEGRGMEGGIQWTGPEGTPPYVNTATGSINS
ncbi:MAG: arylsulfatase A-like enzyme [Cyclobacteriaceae bacterium]|jgi:arylsulfatase A-like enzyme